MSTSDRLTLPYLQPSQAQKHVTHNEALQRLDVLVQLAVEATGASTPPGLPYAGATWALGPAPSGAWAGHAGDLAAWVDNAWLFIAPAAGWLALDKSTGKVQRHDGSTWQDIALPELANLAGVGINTPHDSTNRLSVSASATLLTHEGAGHRLKLNKAAAPDTASLLFQTGFSARAEMGCTGADDFAIKVSPDGSVWHTVLRADRATGGAGFGPGGGGDEFFTFSANSVGTGLAVRNTGGIGGAAFRAIDDASGADWKFKTTGNGNFKLRDEANATDRMELFPGSDGAIVFSGPVRLAAYTVAGLPSAATAGAGAQVLVSDEAGGAVPAFSDGSTWRRVTDRAVVS